MNIFTLVGSIMVDSDKANESISKTEEKAGGLAQKLGGVIGTAGKVGLAIGGAAVAGGAALYGMANKAAESTDRIDKMSQRLGMTRESFQEWDYILSQNGVSMDSMNTAMKSMTTAMSDLDKGGKKGQETLAKLGITTSDLKNLKQEEVFEKAVVALQNMDEGYEKARLAQQLFGKQGQEMLPMLNQSKGSIEELKNKARDLGLVMSDDAVDAGVKFTDTMDSLKRSFGAVATQVGVSVMPIIQQLMEWVIENMPTIQAVFKTAFDVISEVVNIAIDIFKTLLLPILETLYSWISENMPVIQETFKKVFGTAKKVIEEVWKFVSENLMPIFKAIFDSVSDKFPKMQKIFSDVFGVAKDVVSVLWDVFKGLWEFIEPTFPLIGTVIDAAFKVVIGVVESVTAVFKTLVGWIKDAVSWIKQFNSTEMEEKTTGSSGSFGGISKNVKQYTDGSHANGLAYVPYDGYIAELHKGERVLTANENAQLKDSVVRHEHSGMLRIVGVNSEKEFEAIYDFVTDKIRRESR